MTKQTRRNIQQICLIPPTSISSVVTLVNYNRKRRKVFHFYFHFREEPNTIVHRNTNSRIKTSQEAPNDDVVSCKIHLHYIIELKWSLFIKCLLSRLRSKSRHCTDNLTLEFFPFIQAKKLSVAWR